VQSNKGKIDLQVQDDVTCVYEWLPLQQGTKTANNNDSSAELETSPFVFLQLKDWVLLSVENISAGASYVEQPIVRPKNPCVVIVTSGMAILVPKVR
jgi:hypothetical protein